MIQTTERGPKLRPYLSDLRVLELAGDRCPIACAFAGRLLSDLGATVIKVEPLSGDPTRRIGPFLNDVPGLDRSLLFWHYNADKLGVTLDWRTADGLALLRRLLESADVMLHGIDPTELQAADLGEEALRKLNPRLIVSQVSPFGWDGPYRDYAATDAVHLALGGLMASTGYHDVPGSPPIAGGGGQAWHLGGQWTCIAVMAALLARDAGGEGQATDVAIHDTCAVTTEMALPVFDYTGHLVRRQTGREAHDEILPPWQYRCSDGYISWPPIGIGPDRWMALVDWVTSKDMAEDLTDDTYYIPEVLQEKIQHVCEVMARFFVTMTSTEAYQGLQERGLVSWVLNAPEDLVDDPHLASRNFFVQVQHPELGRSFTYPGSPWAINEDPPLPEMRRAPLFGEDNSAVYGALGLSPAEICVLSEANVI